MNDRTCGNHGPTSDYYYFFLCEREAVTSVTCNTESSFWGVEGKRKGRRKQGSALKTRPTFYMGRASTRAVGTASLTKWVFR